MNTTRITLKYKITPKNTMQVNIKEASRLAGISRTNFYKNYINTGKISTLKDERDRPMVDISELLRVFGGLHGGITGLHDENTQDYTEKYTETPDLVVQLTELRAENRYLAERLAETQTILTKTEEREQWQRQHIEKLTDTLKLLEAPKQAEPEKKGFFKRLFS
jgi:hypothetical protein